MNFSGESKASSAPSLQDEDSAVTLLHHFNEERGKHILIARQRQPNA